MRKPFVGCLLLMLALSLTGCSGGKLPVSEEERQPDIGPDVKAVNSPVDLFHASTELANTLADVLAEITDEDSARKAEAKLYVLTRKAKLLESISKELKFDDPARGAQ